MATNSGKQDNKVHQDAGEYVPGARKMLHENGGLINQEILETFNEDERDKFLTKDNIWKTPDYRGMISKGRAPVYAAMVKVVRDSICTKPHIVPSDLSVFRKQEDYLHTVSHVKEACETASGVDDLEKKLSQVLELHGRKSVMALNGKRKTYFLPWHAAKVKAHDLLERDVFKLKGGPKKKEEAPADKPYMKTGFVCRELSFPKSGKEGFFIYKKSEKTNSVRLGRVYAGPGKTEEEAHKLAMERWTREHARMKEAFKRPHLSHLPNPRYKGITADDLMNTFGFRAIQFGNWLPDSERQVVLDHTYTAFTDLSKALNLPPSSMSLGGKLALAFGSRGVKGAAAHFEKEQNIINLTRMSGAGALAHEWTHAFDNYLNKEFGFKEDNKPGNLTIPYMASSDEQKDQVSSISHANYRRGQFLPGLNSEQRKAFNVYLASLLTNMTPMSEEKADNHKRISNMELKRAGGDYASLYEKLRYEDDMGTLFSLSDPSDLIQRLDDERNHKSKAAYKYYNQPVEVLAYGTEGVIAKILRDKGVDNPYLVNGPADISEKELKELSHVFPYPVGKHLERATGHFNELMHTMVPSMEWRPEPENGPEAERKAIDPKNYGVAEVSGKALPPKVQVKRKPAPEIVNNLPRTVPASEALPAPETKEIPAAKPIATGESVKPVESIEASRKQDEKGQKTSDPLSPKADRDERSEFSRKYYSRKGDRKSNTPSFEQLGLTL